MDDKKINPLAHIKAVTFDAGGTLIAPWPSVGHVYAAVAAENGCPALDVDTLNRQFAAAWRAKENFDHSFEAWAALVDRSFAGLMAQPPSQTFFPALYRRFGLAQSWRIFDDVLPALDWLASQGFILGVISNWDDRLRPLLAEVRLTDCFDAVVISCDAGFTKPSPVIFEHAARKLGVPPAAILHVGDHAREDVAGAQAAGFAALEIDRRGKSAPGRLTSLRELERILGGRHAPRPGN